MFYRFAVSRRPACLWQKDELNVTTATVTGWGHIEFGTEIKISIDLDDNDYVLFNFSAGRNSDNLLKADLEIVENEKCKTFYPSNVEGHNKLGITNNQLCAGSSMKDACQVNYISNVFKKG